MKLGVYKRENFFFKQEKINKLFERKIYEDFDTNNHIQKKKEFRNPRYGAQLKNSITFIIECIIFFI